jgi:hypothetical protein
MDQVDLMIIRKCPSSHVKWSAKFNEKSYTLATFAKKPPATGEANDRQINTMTSFISHAERTICDDGLERTIVL